MPKMTKATLRCLKTLYKTGSIVESSLSDQMKELMSDYCDTRKWFERTPKGRGYKYVLINAEKVRPKLKNFIEKHWRGAFDSVTIANNPTVQNVLNHSDSKATKYPTNGLAFLAGKGKVEVNGKVQDLQALTAQLETCCIGIPIQQLKADKLCFVENYNGVFDRVKVFFEKEYEEGYVFVHVYGRIGESFLQRISANEILIAPDYDYVGLGEYLRCKKTFKKTKLFVPVNYETIYAGHKSELNPNQSYPKEVRESNEPLVVRIRTQLNKNRAFLEQQAILAHNLAERAGYCTCKHNSTIN